MDSSLPQPSPSSYDVEAVKSLVKKWIDHDVEIKRLSRELKGARERRKTIDVQIIEFMENNNIQQFNFPNGYGRLLLSETNSKTNIKPDAMKAVIQSEVGDDKMSAIMEKLNEVREVKTRKTLKHSSAGASSKA